MPENAPSYTFTAFDLGALKPGRSGRQNDPDFDATQLEVLAVGALVLVHDKKTSKHYWAKPTALALGYLELHQKYLAEASLKQLCTLDDIKERIADKLKADVDRLQSRIAAAGEAAVEEILSGHEAIAQALTAIEGAIGAGGAPVLTEAIDAIKNTLAAIDVDTLAGKVGTAALRSLIGGVL